MNTGRKGRLEARLRTRAVSSAPEWVKRHAGPWPLYAAVTGSALAMSTHTPAPGVRLDVPSISAIHRLSDSPKAPLIRAVRLAMADANFGTSFENDAPAAPLATQGMPLVNLGGVVPVYSTVNMIQPGEWVSIYGKNLAGGSSVWQGDFPTQLGGTSVTINGKPA